MSWGSYMLDCAGVFKCLSPGHLEAQISRWGTEALCLMVLCTSWVAFASMPECQRRWERGVEACMTHSVTIPQLQGIVTSDCKEEARKTLLVSLVQCLRREWEEGAWGEHICEACRTSIDFQLWQCQQQWQHRGQNHRGTSRFNPPCLS